MSRPLRAATPRIPRGYRADDDTHARLAAEAARRSATGPKPVSVNDLIAEYAAALPPVE